MGNPAITNRWKYNFRGLAGQQPQKPMSDRFLSVQDSPYTIKIQVESAVYSGQNAYVLRDLPIMKVVDFEGYKVGYHAPKGTIISAVTSATPVIQGIGQGIGNPGRDDKFRQFVKVDDEGKILTDANGNPLLTAIVTSGIDTSAYGYDASITTLFVPANGGTQAVYGYNKVLEREVGSLIDDATKAITIPANIPYGIMVNFLWQDDRGRFLNFDDVSLYSSVRSGRLWIPFVNKAIVTWFGTYSAAADTGVETIGAGYNSVYRDYQFATLDGVQEAGALLKSDIYGKFEYQYDAAGYLNGAVTAQTVGKVMTYDSRYPKHMDPTIQHYPGIKLKGVKTNGIPADLYIFVRNILNSDIAAAKTANLINVNNASATADDIMGAIQSGAFGYVKIDLDVK